MRPHINSFAVLLKKNLLYQVYLNAQIPTILKTFTICVQKLKVFGGFVSSSLCFKQKRIKNDWTISNNKYFFKSNRLIMSKVFKHYTLP